MESVQILLAALFTNARSLDVSKFRVENAAENNRLSARTTYIRLPIYLKAIYGQKNEGNRFFNSCPSMVDISWPSLLKSGINFCYVAQ